jgi:small subunit ribosomal protein S8
MLTRIRNGDAPKTSVSTPASKLRARVLDVLQAEGYIRDYTEVAYDNGKSEFSIELKYHEGAPVIREIARVSKPGRRVYVSVKSIPQVANGLGITILSTPKGVLADHVAREARMLVARFSARSSDRVAEPPTRTDRLNNVSYR